MANYNSNYEIAQEISRRIGTEPIPFESVYEICLTIYNELGGDPTEFESVYEILLGILHIVEGGIASKIINDSTITTDKTWSSSKINKSIGTLQDIYSQQLQPLYIKAVTTVTLALNANFQLVNKIVVQYSVDNVVWYDLTTVPITLQEGDMLYIRGIAIRDTIDITKTPGWFVTTGVFDAFGDIRYLINYKDLNAIPPIFALYNCFRNAGLRKAPHFTAGYVDSNAFYGAFRTSTLEEAMRVDGYLLPTEIYFTDKVNYGTYSNWFTNTYRDCSNLTKTYPIYVSGTFGGSTIYRGCTKLKKAEPIYAYGWKFLSNIFYNCTSLEECAFITYKGRIKYPNVTPEISPVFTNVPKDCKITLSNPDYYNKNLLALDDSYTNVQRVEPWFGYNHYDLINKMCDDEIEWYS